MEERTPGQVPTEENTNTEATEATEAVEEQAQETTPQAEEKPAVDELAERAAKEAARIQALEESVASLAELLKTRLPEPEKPEEEGDPAKELEEARARIEQLEAENAAARLGAAVRDNAEVAGVNPVAVLDSDIARRTLSEIDLADGKAVQAALKSLGEQHRHLLAVTHARVPKAAGSTPAPKASSITREQYEAMSYFEKMEFKKNSPEDFRRLLG